MTTNAIAVWDFSLPKEGCELQGLKTFCKEHCKKWCFQLEKGEKGYIHWQGRVSLKVKNRKGPTFPKIHWSPTSEANCENNYYVMKAETRIEGPWSDKDKYIPRQVREITKLRPWQQTIVDLRNEWNTRTINCIICENGNIGKSTLCTYIGAYGLGRKIPILESYKDFMRMVMDCSKERLYLVDMPRTLSKVGCTSFWAAIETVKDGYAYDDRHTFREAYFDCPNIWVFCNSQPDTTMLSRDRWKFWVVRKDILIPAEDYSALRCNTKNNLATAGTCGTDFDFVKGQII